MIILRHFIQDRFFFITKGVFNMVRYLLLLIVVAFSCTDKKPPKGLLTHAQMVQVLSEIYIAEDKVNRLGLAPDSSSKVFDIMNMKVQSKTGIPDSIFRESLKYYAERPKELEKIYTTLVDSLNLKEQRSSFGKETE